MAASARGRHTWKRRPRQIHTGRAGILLLGRLAADRRRDKTRLTRKLTVISLHLFTLAPVDNLAASVFYIMRSDPARPDPLPAMPLLELAFGGAGALEARRTFVRVELEAEDSEF